MVDDGRTVPCLFVWMMELRECVDFEGVRRHAPNIERGYARYFLVLSISQPSLVTGDHWAMERRGARALTALDAVCRSGFVVIRVDAISM